MKVQGWGIAGRLGRLAAAVGLGLVVVAASLAPWSGTATPAHADGDMCAGDPVIEINGQRANVSIKIPKAMLSFVTAANPVIYRVHVPTNMRARVVAYTGVVPERVEFVYDYPSVPAGQLANLPVQIYAPTKAGTQYLVYWSVQDLSGTYTGTAQAGQWSGSSFRMQF